MSRVKVKICGITQKKQAVQIAEMGADALGFILHPPSKRFIRPEKIREIASDLPPFLTTVGITVNESLENIPRIREVSGLRIFQLHGEESPEYCAKLSKFNIPWFKAFRIKDSIDARLIDKYSGAAALLDAWSDKEYGGTGKQLDWASARQSARTKKIILAGGITPENVVDAIRIARPYAVDTSSGVEIEPGLKSLEKVGKLLDAVASTTI